MRSATLGLILVATSCQSGPRAAPVPPPPPPPDVPAVILVPPSDDLLAYLPGDAGFVVSIDVKRVLAGKPSEMLTGLREVAKGLLVQACGSDPLADLASVAVAFVTDGGQVRVVAVLRGVARDAALDCARHVGPNGTGQVTADSFVITPEAGATTTGLFVDATTAVVSSRSTDTIASLRALVDRGAPLRESPALLTTWDGLPHSAPVEFLLNGQSAIGASMFATQVAHPKVVVGSVALDDIVAIHAVATMAAEGDPVVFSDPAKALVSAAQSVATLHVTTQGAAVTLDASVPKAQFDTVVDNLVRSF